jgi:hypothetical protein
VNGDHVLDGKKMRAAVTFDRQVAGKTSWRRSGAAERA